MFASLRSWSRPIEYESGWLSGTLAILAALNSLQAAIGFARRRFSVVAVFLSCPSSRCTYTGKAKSECYLFDRCNQVFEEAGLTTERVLIG